MMETTLEETRPARSAAPSPFNLPGISADLVLGQSVIVSARWVLIASGLIIALWSPGPVSELRVQVATTLVLAAVNFFLHAQLLVRRPVIDGVVYAASIGDLVVITAIVSSQGGFESSSYIFYYPAILAFAVSFPRIVTVVFTLAGAGLYGLIALGTIPHIAGPSDETALFLRLLTLFAVAACGALYWGVERKRRGDAGQTKIALSHEAEVMS
jgi:hypothetical protein